jgi:hypothetical protein
MRVTVCCGSVKHIWPRPWDQEAAYSSKRDGHQKCRLTFRMHFVPDRTKRAFSRSGIRNNRQSKPLSKLRYQFWKSAEAQSRINVRMRSCLQIPTRRVSEGLRFSVQIVLPPNPSLTRRVMIIPCVFAPLISSVLKQRNFKIKASGWDSLTGTCFGTGPFFFSDFLSLVEPGNLLFCNHQFALHIVGFQRHRC